MATYRMKLLRISRRNAGCYRVYYSNCAVDVWFRPKVVGDIQGMVAGIDSFRLTGEPLEIVELAIKQDRMNREESKRYR